MAEGAEPSLRELFNKAQNQQDDLDSLDPRTSSFQNTLKSITDSLERCRQLIQQLSLFSPNEEVEDISTQNLQYAKPWPGCAVFVLTIS